VRTLEETTFKKKSSFWIIGKEGNLFCGQELETCYLKASHHLPAASCVLVAGRKCNNEKSVSKNLSLT